MRKKIVYDAETQRRGEERSSIQRLSLSSPRLCAFALKLSLSGPTTAHHAEVETYRRHLAFVGGRVVEKLCRSEKALLGYGVVEQNVLKYLYLWSSDGRGIVKNLVYDFPCMSPGGRSPSKGKAPLPGRGTFYM